MKSPLTILLCVAAVTVGAVALLTFRVSHARNQDNGFKRFYGSIQLTNGNSLELPDDAYYFAGLDDSIIYLGHFHRRVHMMAVTTNLRDTQHVTLRIAHAKDYSFHNLWLTVKPPYFYFSDGTIPASFMGKLGDFTARRFMANKSYFIHQLPIGDGRFVNRLLLNRETGQVLGTETVDGENTIHHGLLEKQLDGQFCVEGHMHYDPYTRKFVYVHTYRNDFFVTDTNLDLLFRASTIDTNRRIKMKVATIASNGMHTMASPPMTVNRHSCVDKGVLYVHSRLRADNESIADFKQRSPIDAYRLTNGEYLHSFFAPRKSARAFRIVDNRAFVLDGRELIAYRMTH